MRFSTGTAARAISLGDHSRLMAAKRLLLAIVSRASNFKGNSRKASETRHNDFKFWFIFLRFVIWSEISRLEVGHRHREIHSRVANSPRICMFLRWRFEAEKERLDPVSNRCARGIGRSLRRSTSFLFCNICLSI